MATQEQKNISLDHASISKELEATYDDWGRDNVEKTIRETAITILNKAKDIGKKFANDPNFKKLIDKDSSGGIDKYEKLINELNAEIKSGQLSSLVGRQEVIEKVRARMLKASEEIQEIIKTQEELAKLRADFEGNTAIDDNKDVSKPKPYVFDPASNTYTFDSGANKPAIHSILNINAIQKHSNRLELDYSTCKDQNIKNKVLKALGELTGQFSSMSSIVENFKNTGKLMVTVDKDSQNNDTLVICNINGEPTQQRALIREGVKMKILSKTEKKTEVLKADTFGEGTLNTLTDPNKLELTKVSHELIDTLINRCMKSGISPRDPSSSFSGVWGKGILEFHGIYADTSAAELVFIRPGDVSESMYNLIYKHQADYNTYINNLFAKKRAKREKKNLLADKAQSMESILAPEYLTSIVSFLGKYKGYLEKLAPAESRKGRKQDRIMNHIVHLDDVIHTIQTTPTIDTNSLNTLIKGAIYENNNKLSQTLEKDILSGDKNKFVASLRALDASDGDRKNQSSDLKDMVEGDVSTDDPETQKSLIRLGNLSKDDIFLSRLETTNTKEGLVALLKTYGIVLSQGTVVGRGSEANAVRSAVEEIKNSLPKEDHFIENFTKGLEEEKDDLEKDIGSLTPEQTSRLNILTYIVEHKDEETIKTELDSLAKASLKETKKALLGEGLKSAIKPVLLSRNPAAITGTNADIYKDMIGAGNFNLSDDNFNSMVSGAEMIAQEIAIAVVAMGAGMVTGGRAAGAIYSARMAKLGASGLKIVNKIMNATKLTNLAKFAKLDKIAKGVAVAYDKTNDLLIAKKFLSANNTLIKAGVTRIMEGGSYATINAALHGNLEDMAAGKFATETLKGAGMFSALKVAGVRFPTGFFSRFIMEEGGMNMSDLAINALTGNAQLSKEEVAQNFGLGIIFEALFHCKLSKPAKDGKVEAKLPDGREMRGTPAEIAQEAMKNPEVRADVEAKVQKMDAEIAAKKIELNLQKKEMNDLDNQQKEIETLLEQLHQQNNRTATRGYQGKNYTMSELETKLKEIETKKAALSGKIKDLESNLDASGNESQAKNRGTSTETPVTRTNTERSKIQYKPTYMIAFNNARQLFLSMTPEQVKGLPASIQKFTTPNGTPQLGFTMDDVVNLQQWVGAKPDGILGPNTLAKLKEKMHRETAPNETGTYATGERSPKEDAVKTPEAKADENVAPQSNASESVAPKLDEKLAEAKLATKDELPPVDKSALDMISPIDINLDFPSISEWISKLNKIGGQIISLNGLINLKDIATKALDKLKNSPKWTKEQLAKFTTALGTFIKMVDDKLDIYLKGNENVELMLSKLESNKAKIQKKLEGWPEGNKKEKEAKEKALKSFSDIMSGDATLDKDYAGIRDLKGLNIEEEMLPLIYKIIDNTKKKYPKNPEKRDIKKQINVNEIIKSHLGVDVRRIKFDQNVDMKKYKDGLPTIDQSYDKHNFVLRKEGDDAFNKAMANIDSYLESIPKTSYLAKKEKETLLLAASKMVEYAKNAKLPLSDVELHNFVTGNLNKLMYQDISDRIYLAGSDHGILHVVNGDMFGAIRIMESLGSDMKPEERLQLLQMIVDHDLGYTMNAFDDMLATHIDIFYAGSKDHPLYSRVYIDAHAEEYIKIFGKEAFDKMRVAMLDHSDVHTMDIQGLAKKEDRQALMQAIIANVDCIGVTHVDKTPALFLNHPEMMSYLQEAHDLGNFLKESGIKDEVKEEIIKETKDRMIAAVKAMKLDDKHKASFINSIEKTFNANKASFPISFNYSSFCYSFKSIDAVPGGIAVKLDFNKKMFDATNANFGPEVALANIFKAMGDYGFNKNPGTKDKVWIDGKETELSSYFELDKEGVSKLNYARLSQDLSAANKSIEFKTVKKDGSHATFDLEVKNPGANEALALRVGKGKEIKKAMSNVIEGLSKLKLSPRKYRKELKKNLAGNNRKKELDSLIKEINDNSPIADEFHTRVVQELSVLYRSKFDAALMTPASSSS